MKHFAIALLFLTLSIAKDSAASPMAPPQLAKPKVEMEKSALGYVPKLIPTLNSDKPPMPDAEREMLAPHPKTTGLVTDKNINRVINDFQQGRKIMTEYVGKAGKELGHAWVEGEVNSQGPGGGYYIPPAVEHPKTSEEVEKEHPTAYGVAGGAGEYIARTAADPATWIFAAAGATAGLILCKVKLL